MEAREIRNDDPLAAAIVSAIRQGDAETVASLVRDHAGLAGYGCWNVARLLAGYGARVDTLWQAAALGVTARVAELLDADPRPGQEEIDHAFWQACHGGQRRTAEYLFARGADINAIPDHSPHTPLDIASQPSTRSQAVVSWLREHGARSAS